MVGMKKARYIWVVIMDGERVKAFDEIVHALRFVKCLNDCGIAMARLDWWETIQFAKGRRGYVLSYVYVFEQMSFISIVLCVFCVFLKKAFSFLKEIPDRSKAGPPACAWRRRGRVDRDAEWSRKCMGGKVSAKWFCWRHRAVDRETRAHVGLAKLGLGERRFWMGL